MHIEIEALSADDVRPQIVDALMEQITLHRMKRAKHLRPKVRVEAKFEQLLVFFLEKTDIIILTVECLLDQMVPLNCRWTDGSI